MVDKSGVKVQGWRLGLKSPGLRCPSTKLDFCRRGNKCKSKALLSNLYTVPLEHKVDYEVRQTKTDQGDHHDDSDAMKQRLLKIGKKS